MNQDSVIYTLIGFVILNVVFSIILYLHRKNNMNNESKKRQYKFYFGSQFFSISIFPTLILIATIADSLFDVIAIYVYSIILVLLANTTYQKLT